ncbi:hypothetical protein CAPTEDRAFT_197216 [Capitella teleta]|uniref:Uncharacterized protein n=1 Tax=Capitella teleta TaxID=283909 RepID=R7TPL4_CAPTE|nr:hypothetical protein CAPTEDRAFT_197216 [Capitella teleta]|eukprot:ELT95798.1 hypothetical protein CAPTEDRAFT_197216 [Capitella teleta]
MDKKRRGAENLSTFMDDVMPTPQCKENIEAAVAHPFQMLAEKKALTKENKTMKRKLEATAHECQANETQEQTEQVLKICSELEFVSCYCAGYPQARRHSTRNSKLCTMRTKMKPGISPSLKICAMET